MKSLALLLAAGVTLALRGQELRRFELKVQPPDYIFHFQPRPELPGRPHVVLALSGGGARGLAHLGVLQRLDEEGYPIDGVVGTSIGAMMGGLYAAGFSGKEIEELFRQVDFSKAFIDPLRRQPGRTLAEQEESSAALLSLQTQGGVFTLAQGLQSGKPVQRALEGLFARAAYFSQGRFDDLKVPLRILSTNLETGQGRVFARGDLVEVVRASMAMPGGFEPVLIEGQQYVDGALVENLPVDVAKANFQGAFVLASDISSPFEQRRGGNFLSIAARSLDLMIERRQWESRDHADFMLRPVLKDASFTDYRPQMNALVEAGRRVFDAEREALNAKLLSRFELMAPLGTKAIRIDSPEALPTRAQAALAQLLPEGRDPSSDQVNIVLHQLLLHGWAKEAWATLDAGEAGPTLTVHARPWPEIRDVVVEAPPDRLAGTAEAVRSTMYVGDRFNPEVFGQLLSNLVHGMVLEGAPLADVRGSSFDPATGVVRVVLKEPLVRAIAVRPPEGVRLHTEYLENLMGGLLGQPLRIDTLQRDVALGEQRLSLGELRAQERPSSDGQGVELELVPVPEHKQSLEATVGYESTLGGQLGLAYTSRNLWGSGVEFALSGARNRLEREAEAALRGPFRFFPGAGLELRAAWAHERLEPLVSFPNAELSGTPYDSAIGTLEAGLGGFLRFGATGTGKLGLEMEWRRATYELAGQSSDRTEHLLLGSLEWDDFDRHTLPREGLLLRLRGGLGQSKDGPQAGQSFQLGYGRLRFLRAFNERVGFDLNLEGGLGHQLPLDRWWPFGGGAQMLGSQARGILAPNLVSASLGLPLRFLPGLGLVLELEPRVDAARFAGNSNELGRSLAVRATSMGLAARTTLSQFYVEAAFGLLKLQAPGLDGRTHGRVDLLIGTQPFDLWKRR